MIFGIKDEHRRADLIRFVKFCLVGVLNTLVYYGIYYLLIKLDVVFVIATTVGTIAGIINSYIWNKLFVFNASKKVTCAEISKFVAVYAIQYLCNLAVLFVCITYIGISAEISGLIAAGISAMVSYIGLRFWGFKHAKDCNDLP